MGTNFAAVRERRGDLAVPLAHEEHNSLPNCPFGVSSRSSSIPTDSYYYHTDVECIDGCTLCTPIAGMAILLLVILIFLPVAFLAVSIFFVVASLVLLCSGNCVPQVQIYSLIRKARNEVEREAKMVSRNQHPERHPTSENDSRDTSPSSIHSPALDITDNRYPATVKDWSCLSGTYICHPKDADLQNMNAEGTRWCAAPTRTVDLVLSESSTTPSSFFSRRSTDPLFGIYGGKNNNNDVDDGQVKKRLWKISGHSMSVAAVGETETASELGKGGAVEGDIATTSPRRQGRRGGNDRMSNDRCTIGFVVSQGLLADSGRAYWVEHHQTVVVDGAHKLQASDAPCLPPRSFCSSIAKAVVGRTRKVLVQGTLEYDTQRFTWTDSNGNSGVYSTLSRHNPDGIESASSEVPTTSTTVKIDNKGNESAPDYDMNHQSFDDDGDEERDPSTSKGSIRRII